MRCNRFSFPSLSSSQLLSSSLSPSTLFFLLFECLSFLGIRFTMSPTLGSSAQRRRERKNRKSSRTEWEKIEAKKDETGNKIKTNDHHFLLIPFPSPSSSFLFLFLSLFFFLSFSFSLFLSLFFFLSFSNSVSFFSFLPKGTKRKKQSKTEKD